LYTFGKLFHLVSFIFGFCRVRELGGLVVMRREYGTCVPGVGIIL
jgi:hypothetical protein